MLLGVLVALLGIATMIYLGPDGRRTSGPHPIATDGIAIVTAPKALSWVGVRIDVLAELPANKPVFVGLGNAVDVNDYLKDTTRIEVDSFHPPFTVTTRNIKGRDNLPAAPTSLNWWLASNAGLGGASIDVTLPSDTVRLAILSVGSSNLRGLNLTVAYGIRGGFAKGAGLALLGFGGIWFGRMLRRGDELWTDTEVDDEEVEEIEEVVYVYVDDDGVEHEISAEEAGQYDIEEEAPEPVAVAAPEPTPEPETSHEPDPEPEPRRKRWNKFTAGAIVAAEPVVLPEPDPAPVLEVSPPPEPTPPPAQAEPVVYVYVDDDGVEHEIGEAELADYDIVDQDQEDRP